MSAHEVPQEFIEHAKKIKNPVIADIGSRDATEGLYIFDILNAKALHIFEPNPFAIKICKKNISEYNGDNNIFLNEIALSNKPGDVSFYPVNPKTSVKNDIGLSSMLKVNPEYTKRRGKVEQDEITVEASTADIYFESKEKPNILWIDVEGAELLVLEGAINTLKSVELIHIEVSFRPMHVGKPLFHEIDQFLIENNFKLSSFVGASKFKSFLLRHKLLPNLPWRMNAIYQKV